ncbi:MAG: serine/threonine protein kinase, partial [Kofleriaceae bacterium]
MGEQRGGHIRPSSVIVSYAGDVKLGGFALHKLSIARRSLDVGRNSDYSYFSPEQCRGHVIDHQTDVYSLGVVLYELLATTAPFTDRSSDFETMKAIVEGSVRPPSQLREDLPPELERIVLEALLPRDRRLPSATALIDALDRIAQSHELRASALDIARYLTVLTDAGHPY